jgi:hypothetical protein
MIDSHKGGTMRVAVLIIGLLLGLALFLQTLIVYAASSASEQDDLAASAAIGVLMAVMWLVACALVLGFPMASVVIFALAGVFGLLSAGTAEFHDLYVWGGISFVLALLSWFGWRGKRSAQREANAERQRQRDRDAQLDALLTKRT